MWYTQGGSKSPNIWGEIRNLLKNKHMLANIFAALRSFTMIFGQNDHQNVLYKYTYTKHFRDHYTTQRSSCRGSTLSFFTKIFFLSNFAEIGSNLSHVFQINLAKKKKRSKIPNGCREISKIYLCWAII